MAILFSGSGRNFEGIYVYTIQICIQYFRWIFVELFTKEAQYTKKLYQFQSWRPSCFPDLAEILRESTFIPYKYVYKISDGYLLNYLPNKPNTQENDVIFSNGGHLVFWNGPEMVSMHLNHKKNIPTTNWRH